MKPLKLFMFDFDGTALGGHEPYDQFPRHFSKFLDKLDAMGIRWATNTTWGPQGQYTAALRGGVKSEPVLLTGQTGRMIATVKNHKVIMEREHEQAVLRRERRFHLKHWDEVRKAALELLRRDLVDRLSLDEWNQVSFHCDRRHSKEVWGILRPFVESGAYYSWNAVCKGNGGMLVAYFHNKGAILKLVMKRLHIGPENVIIAGDGINDLHMFEPNLARWMVCPDNAEPLLKEKVRRYSGIVSKKKYSWGVVDGVKQVLRKLGYV
jgi:hydroxymethylpyrimidine pyrophosphatase-like HAD family hydrolase